MWMAILLTFTILTSLLLIVGLPVMFVCAVVTWLRQRNLTSLFVFFSIVCGLAIGLVAAWSYVVFHEGWHLSFIETNYACYHSDIYGGAIEDAAEDYFFFTLFFGDIGAILAGVAGWLAARHRPRLAVSN
jgi:hypothetical protein